MGIRCIEIAHRLTVPVKKDKITLVGVFLGSDGNIGGSRVSKTEAPRIGSPSISI